MQDGLRDSLLLRERPASRWYELREKLIKWLAITLDVPVATHFGSGGPSFDYKPEYHGDRYLFFFKRYNHRRDSVPLRLD